MAADRHESELPIDELLERIREGHRLVVFTASQTLARQRLTEVADAIIRKGDEPVTVYRTNGQEEIRCALLGDRGRVSFRTVSMAWHYLDRHHLDAVYLEGCDFADVETRAAVAVSLFTSTLSEIVHC